MHALREVSHEPEIALAEEALKTERSRESILRELGGVLRSIAAECAGLLSKKELESFARVPDDIGPRPGDLNRVIELKAFNLVRKCEDKLQTSVNALPPGLDREGKIALAKEYLLAHQLPAIAKQRSAWAGEELDEGKVEERSRELLEHPDVLAFAARLADDMALNRWQASNARGLRIDGEWHLFGGAKTPYEFFENVGEALNWARHSAELLKIEELRTQMKEIYGSFTKLIEVLDHPGGCSGFDHVANNSKLLQEGPCVPYWVLSHDTEQLRYLLASPTLKELLGPERLAQSAEDMRSITSLLLADKAADRWIDTDISKRFLAVARPEDLPAVIMLGLTNGHDDNYYLFSNPGDAPRICDLIKRDAGAATHPAPVEALAKLLEIDPFLALEPRRRGGAEPRKQLMTHATDLAVHMLANGSRLEREIASEFVRLNRLLDRERLGSGIQSIDLGGLGERQERKLVDCSINRLLEKPDPQLAKGLLETLASCDCSQVRIRSAGLRAFWALEPEEIGPRERELIQAVTGMRYEGLASVREFVHEAWAPEKLKSKLELSRSPEHPSDPFLPERERIVRLHEELLARAADPGALALISELKRFGFELEDHSISLLPELSAEKARVFGELQFMREVYPDGAYRPYMTEGFPSREEKSSGQHAAPELAWDPYLVCLQKIPLSEALDLAAKQEPGDERWDRLMAALRVEFAQRTGSLSWPAKEDFAHARLDAAFGAVLRDLGSLQEGPAAEYFSEERHRLCVVAAYPHIYWPLKAVAERAAGIFPDDQEARRRMIGKMEDLFARMQARVELNPEVAPKVFELFEKGLRLSAQRELGREPTDSEVFEKNRLSNAWQYEFALGRYALDERCIEMFRNTLSHDSDPLLLLRALTGASVETSDPSEVVDLIRRLVSCRDALGHDAELALHSGIEKIDRLGSISTVAEFSRVLEFMEQLPKQGRSGAAFWEAFNQLTSGLWPGETGQVRKPVPLSDLQHVAGFLTEFGNLPLTDLYKAYCHLQNGLPPSEEMLALGIDQSGPAGSAKLQRLVFDLQRKLLSGLVPEAPSTLELDVIAAVCRFNVSDWRRDKALSTLIDSFASDVASGSIAPLASEYAPRRFEAKKLNAQELSEFKFSEVCHACYALVRDDILAVRGKKAREVFESERAALLEALTQEIDSLEQPLSAEERAKTKEPEKREQGRRQRAKLFRGFSEELSASSSSSDLISKLAGFEGRYKTDNSGINQALRRLALRAGLEQQGSAKGIAERLDRRPLDRDRLSGMLEFCTNAVLQEGLAGVELDKKGRQAIGKTLGISTFEGDLKRIGDLATSGSEEFEALPSRGLLGELSGYICDACWTRSSDIMKKNPGLVPVLFVRNPDSPIPRLAGATLLIPAESSAGEKVLVVRGFNPLQNVISRLKPGDFLEQFVDRFVVPIAKELGVTKIVIPGGASGGSQTNRPDINLHVSRQYADAKDISLKSTELLRFNGYDIKSSCKVIREL